jgi:hypothetical protein
MPSKPSLCSFNRVCKVDLGSSLLSGGRTLWCGQNNGNIAKHFYWSKLRQDVQNYIKSCNSCTISKHTIKKHGLYTPLPTPDRPWESISMDFMSSILSTKHENDCFFVIVDRFSNIEILVLCNKSITAEATTKLFFERVWVHFGLPQTIILDRYKCNTHLGYQTINHSLNTYALTTLI